jgi:hypothetical protein
MGYECLDLNFFQAHGLLIVFRLRGYKCLDLFFSGSQFTPSITFSELCHFC